MFSYEILPSKSYVVATHVFLLKSESMRSIYIEYFSRNFHYFGYSFYIMVKVIKCVVFT